MTNRAPRPRFFDRGKKKHRCDAFLTFSPLDPALGLHPLSPHNGLNDDRHVVLPRFARLSRGLHRPRHRSRVVLRRRRQQARVGRRNGGRPRQTRQGMSSSSIYLLFWEHYRRRIFFIRFPALPDELQVSARRPRRLLEQNGACLREGEDRGALQGDVLGPPLQSVHLSG